MGYETQRLFNVVCFPGVVLMQSECGIASCRAKRDDKVDAMTKARRVDISSQSGSARPDPFSSSFEVVR